MKMDKGKKAVLLAVCILPFLLLTACREQEGNGVSHKSYYVISEELDSKKTADKAQEILENAQPTSDVSGNDVQEKEI